MKIRKAIITEVIDIHKLLNHYARQDLLLPRSLSELYRNVRDYFILYDEDDGDKVLGVCGLGIVWEDLAEIKSLAIDESSGGKGLGSMLVKECLKEAQSLGLKRVFTLTYVPPFFKKLGFKEVEKSILPQKIWADCLNCPKFPNCDEIALMIDL